MPSRRQQVVDVLGPELLASPWLTRLGGISFLGTLDEHPRSRRVSTRLEHSIGVAKLAADAAAALELPPGRARLFVTASLLHDVGHYPLSHAAEPAFAKLFGANHHELGRWIVLGEGQIPRSRSLRPLLERMHIDPQLCWGIIDRSPDLPAPLQPLAELLKAPINLDTLEGISRVARDFRVHPRKLPERIFTWIDGELAIAGAALPDIDRFWQLKDEVYDRVINLPSNILAEARLCELVAAKIDPDTIDDLDRFDDQALRQSLGEEALASLLLDGDDGGYELWASEQYGAIVGATDSGSGSESDRQPVLVRTRKRYFVDRSVTPRARGLVLGDWPRRFRHERTRGWLVSRRQDQLSLPLPGLDSSTRLPVDAWEI